MFNKRFFNVLTSILLLGAITLSACAPKPENVAERLVNAVNSQDIQGALALFAEDAVVDTGEPAPYNGTAEIQGWLEGLASDNYEVRVENVKVNGDTVIEQERLSMDSWKDMGLSSLEGTREIKIQDGHIQSLVFNFSETSPLEQRNRPIRTLHTLTMATQNINWIYTCHPKGSHPFRSSS